MFKFLIFILYQKYMETSYGELLNILKNIDYSKLSKNPKINKSNYKNLKDVKRIEKMHNVIAIIKSECPDLLKLIEDDLYFILYGYKK